jgi:hypothetical protein
VLVHCETSNITKAKAKEALVGYSSLAEQEVEAAVVYISKVESSKRNYLLYCYKTVYNNTMSKDDVIIKDAIDDLKVKGRIPNSAAIKRKIIDEHGASAFNKRFKPVIETYLAETDISDPRGNPIVELDTRQNCINFLVSVLCWLKIISVTKISTGYKEWANIDKYDLERITFMISLLPYFTRRVQGTSDGLPCLYLWGIQCAGKSSLFSNCRYIKKIPTDSSGVSRFRMDKMHTAVLFDDIEADTINNRENSSTLKQLSLGGDVEVKTMGATQSIKGFVIITSNSQPSYFNDESTTINPDGKEDRFVDRKVINMSWKRRFITCEFTHTCPFDASTIDYDDLKLRDIAAHMFVKMYEAIDENLLSNLKVYYDIAKSDYISDDSMTWCNDLMDEAATKVNQMVIDNTDERSPFRFMKQHENAVNNEIRKDITDNVDFNEIAPTPVVNELEIE